MEEIHKIQDELKEEKEEIKKNGDELLKVCDLNESLIEVQKLKQENIRKWKWEKDKSM